ncbi:MAG: integrase/recombinase XerD [Myxococcota bacterium]|jgi:integrase/recombinase XerD
MSDVVRPLQCVVRDFFEKHLAIGRSASPNTVASYRDGMKLYLRYAATVHNCSADLLGYDMLDVTVVRGFLEWLRTERDNGPRTRNQRLAMLKSFAAYVATVDPRHLERCRAVQDLRRAKYEHPEPQWLDENEIPQLVASVRPAHRERDRALLLLLYDTGARVQEVADLNVGDIHTSTPAFIQFRAKGGRQRTSCIGNETLRSLREWCDVRPDAAPNAPLFVNARGERLTRAPTDTARLEGRAARRLGFQIADSG